VKGLGALSFSPNNTLILISSVLATVLARIPVLFLGKANALAFDPVVAVLVVDEAVAERLRPAFCGSGFAGVAGVEEKKEAKNEEARDPLSSVLLLLAVLLVVLSLVLERWR